METRKGLGRIPDSYFNSVPHRPGQKMYPGGLTDEFIEQCDSGKQYWDINWGVYEQDEPVMEMPDGSFMVGAYGPNGFETGEVTMKTINDAIEREQRRASVERFSFTETFADDYALDY